MKMVRHAAVFGFKNEAAISDEAGLLSFSGDGSLGLLLIIKESGLFEAQLMPPSLLTH